MDFLSWKVDGFEIANSAPRALDFPSAYKRLIIRHCRQQNLFVDGVSDNHGWGCATSVWNAMRIPGWQRMDPDQLETAVLKTLKRDGFQSVRVLERIKYFPENTVEIIISPLANAFVYMRTLGGWRIFSWLVWIGLVSMIRRRTYAGYSRISMHGRSILFIVFISTISSFAGADMTMPGMYGSYSMSREASGTSWQPDSSLIEGIHTMSDTNMYMVHGFANGG
jgi:hypothetical protein